MSVQKKAVLAGLMLTSYLATGAPAAGASEQDDVLSALQAVAGAWNQGHMPAASNFEPSLTVVDNTPPYLFQGPDAVADWIKAYRDRQPKGTEDSKTSLHFLNPETVEITGARAYVAIPADWQVELHGKTDVSHGIITAVLRRAGKHWRIATWVWTPR